MLSEAFLSTVLYEKVMGGISGPDETQKKTSLNCPHNAVRRAEERRSCKVTPLGGGAWGGDTLAPSGSPDLYTSWSSNYANLYKNYPDLHIGGDHILKEDSGCVLECEDGPVLLSVDIDSGSPPTHLLEGPPEGGTLRSEDGHALPTAPFSNSALNGFLEKKMQELYKQCYEETLGTNAGSSNPGWPYVLMVNINQMSLMVSQEQNMDQAKAREAILQYLYSATSGGSSEFVTPVLHISSQGNKKRSGTLSKKLRP